MRPSMAMARLSPFFIAKPPLRRQPFSTFAVAGGAPVAIDSSASPLFLRPLTHSVPTASILAFRRWAEDLVRSSPLSSDSSSLLRELSWLLSDAAGIEARIDPSSAPVMLRVSLPELYALWKSRIELRKPFQYIVGCEHWRDLVLGVREGVLIPRPETEMVVDLVKGVEGFERGIWSDLGTGSGAIAVGIGCLLEDEGKVVAVDVSEAALEVARFNVERYGLKDKVDVRQGSWFDPLEDVRGKLAGVISNPPYIPTGDLPDLQPEVGWHEPWLALDGGKQGLDHLLHISKQLSSALKPGGYFVLETNGDIQSEILTDFMRTEWGSYFCDVTVVHDFAGIKRFVTGFRR